MWLNLLVLLMLILITFFQALQGLFSALILLVLAVISSVVAFGFYEDLYRLLIVEWQPEHGEAMALMGIFLVTLILLRLLVDFVIKGNVSFPLKADRAGGAVLGFLAAMIMTGTTATAIQMLPFGHEVLGFARYREANGRIARSGLLLGVDGFASGLAELIVDGSLSAKRAGEGKFREIHPDLLAEIDWKRSVGPFPERQTVPKGSARVVQVWQPNQLVAADRKTKLSPPAGKSFLGVRLNISGNALRRSFTPAQVRLVAWRGNRTHQYIPRGAGDTKSEPIEVRPLERFSVGASMDFVFEVPANVTPWFVEFKRWCRAEITKEQLDEGVVPAYRAGLIMPEQTQAPQKPARKPAKKPEVRRPAGRVHGASLAFDQRPQFSDKLPRVLPRNELLGQDADISGGVFRSGHVVVDLTDARIVPAALGVSRLKVPDGKRLLQVPLREVFAESLIGRAIAITVKTLRHQWKVVDDLGNPYTPVGLVAIAKSGGRRILELQYWPDSLGADRRVGQFRRLKDDDFRQPDAVLVYFYLVKPGRRIVKFDTGRAETDLSELNLVAPR